MMYNDLFEIADRKKMRSDSKALNNLCYKSEDYNDDATCDTNEKNYEKLNISKSMARDASYIRNCLDCIDSNYYTFNIIYFFSCIGLIFVLIFLNIINEHTKKIQNHSKLFPAFFSLKTIQPYIFLTAITIITITGLINVWNFSIILLQRFSVPELSKKKFIIYFMIIIGTFSHIFLVIYAISSGSIEIKNRRLRLINLSFNVSIYLLFLLSNVIYAFLSWLALEQLMKQNFRLESNMRDSVKLKIYVLFLEVILLCVYMFTIISYNSHRIKKHEDN